MLLSSICYADEVVTTKDGKQVLLKDDNTWEYVDQNSENQPTSIPIKANYADEAVEVWNAYLELGEVNYSNAVRLYIDYKNNTDKKVIGVSINVSITNPFGKTVYENTFNDEVVLEPLERLKNDTYWYFQDNQFIDDEPYDGLWQMAQKGTAKIKTKILTVIFEDGTVLKARPVKK